MHGPAGSYAHVALQSTGRVCPAAHPAPLALRVPGAHSPLPLHSPLATHMHRSSQRSGCDPQNPHSPLDVVPGMHVPCASHAPYSHSPLAVQKRSRVPHMPQGTCSSAPGVGHASTMHSPIGSNVHASVQRSSRCPRSQPSRDRMSSPGSHAPPPVHSALVSHVHDAVQSSRRVPHAPHVAVRDSPGTHAPPSDSHTPYSHTPRAVQKRSTLPHMPHATDSIAPGVVHGSSRGSDASTRATPPSPPIIGSPPPPHATSASAAAIEPLTSRRNRARMTSLQAGVDTRSTRSTSPRRVREGRHGARASYTHVLRVLTSLVVAVVSLSTPASAQPQRLALHVTSVEGAVPRRALARALERAPLADCQCTHMGGPMRLALRIDERGAVSVDALVANEEIRVYARCVRATLARVALGAQRGPTTARVTLVFPSTGLGAHG